MADLADIIQAAQEEIATLHAEAAHYIRNKAIFEAAAAQSHYERAQLAHKEQEIMLQRARNANRPSVFLGAEVTQAERDGRTVWVASVRGVSAEGNSPETAFLAFDELWTQGSDSDE
jgi:hypothetical protein